MLKIFQLKVRSIISNIGTSISLMFSTVVMKSVQTRFTDFLDASDKSLCHLIAVAKKANSFPLAILDVTVHGGRCSPEYLVCFHEVGVFVDQYGRRSREEDIKWGHVPFAFGNFNCLSSL